MRKRKLKEKNVLTRNCLWYAPAHPLPCFSGSLAPSDYLLVRQLFIWELFTKDGSTVGCLPLELPVLAGHNEEESTLLCFCYRELFFFIFFSPFPFFFPKQLQKIWIWFPVFAFEIRRGEKDSTKTQRLWSSDSSKPTWLQRESHCPRLHFSRLPEQKGAASTLHCWQRCCLMTECSTPCRRFQSHPFIFLLGAFR